MQGLTLQGGKPPARWRVFVENHKGDLTLAVSALAFAASWGILTLSPWHEAGEIARSISEASLVGGLCDYIALKMIFERRWYLPHSGVLPRNRQRLIDGIAATIESQWLTPAMIEEKLHEADLVKRLGRYLEEVSVDGLIDHGNLSRICHIVAHYVESEQLLDFFEERLRAVAPRPLRLANSMGLLSYRAISLRIAAELSRLISELPDNAPLSAALEAKMHTLGEELQQRGSPMRETAYRMMDTLVEYAVSACRGQIAEMVRVNLMRLDDEEIRRQIETRTRTHLDWIRVNGGLFGAIFGALFGLLNFAVLHAGAISALLR